VPWGTLELDIGTKEIYGWGNLHFSLKMYRINGI